MSNIDYTALINDDIVEETPAVMSMRAAPATERWIPITGFKQYKGGKLNSDDFNLYDEDYSVIDKKKNIILDENQANLHNESFGQFIPFKIERYRDGIDLTEATAIVVNYIRPTEEEIKQESVVNVEYNPTSNELRFGWLVSGEATAIEGDLQFAIEFIGSIYQNDTPLNYSMKTAPSTLRIKKTIGSGTQIDLPDNWDTTIVDTIVERVAATAVVDELASNYYNKQTIDTKFNELEKPNLAPYVDKQYVDLTLDSSTYILTLKYGQGDNDKKVIDLPLETVVVNGEYDNTNKKIILTLKNGNKIEIGVSDIITGLATTGNLETLRSELEAAIEEAISASEETTNQSIDALNDKIGELDEYETAVEYIEGRLGVLEREEGVQLTVKQYVDGIDISGRLGDLGKAEDGETDKTVEEFVNDKFTVYDTEIKNYIAEAIDGVDVTEELEALSDEFDNKLDIGEAESVAKFVENKGYATTSYVDEKVSDIELDDYYDKDEVDEKLGDLIIDNTPYSVTDYVNKKTSEATTHNYYKAEYGIDENGNRTEDSKHTFTLWLSDNPSFVPGQQGTAVSNFEIVGGAGGDDSNKGKLTIYFDEANGKIFNSYTFREEDVANNNAIIKYKISAVNAAGQPMSSVGAKWEIAEAGSNIYKVINTDDISLAGNDTKQFNISEELTANKDYDVRLTINDKGSTASTSIYWTVRRMVFKLIVKTLDTQPYNLSKLPKCEFQAQGKDTVRTVHFVFDDLVEETKTITSNTGNGSYTFPIEQILSTRRHGAHSLKVWMTAEINGVNISTEPTYLEYIFYNEGNPQPIIACPEKNITTKQYLETPIRFSVYRKDYTDHKIVIEITDEEPQEQLTSLFNNVYRYKSPIPKTITMKISYPWEESEKYPVEQTIQIEVKELGYPIQIADGAIIDFDPINGNNNDRIVNEDGTYTVWSNGTQSLKVSENFDWANGGYQRDIDKNGIESSVFVIRAGTYAEFDYHFFGTNGLKSNGSDFKLIFKTNKVEREDAEIVRCFSDLKDVVRNENGEPIYDENGQVTKIFGGEPIGFRMHVHEAYVYNGSKENYLHLPYSEEDVIEFGFQITKASSKTPMIIGHEDGVMTCAMTYTDGAQFTQDQYDRQFIRLGSEHCDLVIYKVRIYEKELNNEEFLGNFIADARSGEEIVDRYERNQIYDGDQLTPEYIAKKYPHLRVITISTPSFTTGKKYPVGQDSDGNKTTIEYRYNGAEEGELSYWKCEDAAHVGQGTSSDLYGASGRNIDLILRRHKDKETGNYVNDRPLITTNDPNNLHPTKVALTKTSVPVDYFNIKVNIASSENANNALLQKRFNRYQPYKRPFVRTDGQDLSFIKDTMEFYNCVVFIQETGDGQHSEFNDKDVHFYAIGNIGDSKKTDETRLTDPADKYECCLEIRDVRLPLSDFPSNTWTNAEYSEEKKGKIVYPFLNEDYIEHLRMVVDGELIPIPEGHEFDPATNEYVIDGRKVESFDDKETYNWRYLPEVDEKDFVDEPGGKTAKQQAEEKNAEISTACQNAWWAMYDFVVHSTDEDFYNNFEKYFVLDSALYYYLFTERYTMVDNRAKNSFWHYAKTGETYTEDVEFRDKDNKILYTVHAGDPVRKWDLNWGYDMDTSLGIDNDGDMVYRYGLEDDMSIDDEGVIQYPEEGKPSVFTRGTEIFRESDSTFFARLRKLFGDELAEAYAAIEVATPDAWDDESLIKEFDNWQSEFPEELWRKDIERKYFRTFTGESIDNSIPVGKDGKYLDSMANGKKKYQRRQFERNQAKYMASKYHSKLAAGAGVSNNYIDLRCNDVSGKALVVEPNYDFELTPYAYMYLTVSYGGERVVKRVTELNRSYELKKPVKLGNKVPEFIYIESASWISSLGDLSPKYLKKINTSNAEKLQVLTVGSDAFEESLDVPPVIEYYRNPNLEDLTISSNELLEILNIQNIGYKKDLDLTGLNNLREVYAQGTDTQNFISANGGELEKAYLPAVGSIKLTNLSQLQTLELDNYDNLTSINVENCNSFDWIEFFTRATKIKRFRMRNVDWTLQNTDLLKKLSNSAIVTNLDQTGPAELSGTITVYRITDRELVEYTNLWKELTIITPNGTIPTHTITFKNPDVNGTIGKVWDEYTQYVPNKEHVVEPTFVPTLEPTTQYTYTFKHWYLDGTDETIEYDYNSRVEGPLTLVAYYEPTIRKYTITYHLGISDDAEVQTTRNATYGSYISYIGENPVDTSGEDSGIYRVFKGWDKSGYVTSDKDIYPVFDEFTYTTGMFAEDEQGERLHLNELSAAGVYALSKTEKALNIGEYYKTYEPEDVINLKMGETYETFTDLTTYDYSEERVVKVYNGSNGAYSSIPLLQDEDFVFVIDYTMENSNGVFCSNWVNNIGFQLQCENGSQKLKYSFSEDGERYSAKEHLLTSSGIMDKGMLSKFYREVLVLAHKKGDKSIKVYFSDKNNNSILEKTMDFGIFPTPKMGISFGAERSGEDYVNNGKGEIHWVKKFDTFFNDNECRRLASWSHETIEMFLCLKSEEASGNTSYKPITYPIFGDEMNTQTKLTFMSRDLMEKTSTIYSNDIANWGDASSIVRIYLNSRIPQGISTSWAQLFKNVLITSVGKDGETNAESRVFLPSVSNLINNSGYKKEGDLISCFTLDSTRQATRKGETTPLDYWLRSRESGWYTYYVTESGAVTRTYNPESENKCLRIMMSI